MPLTFEDIWINKVHHKIEDDFLYLKRIKKKKGWYQRHKNRILWKWKNKGIRITL